MKANKTNIRKALVIIEASTTQLEAKTKLQSAGIVSGLNFDVWAAFNSLKK